jgi:hypothetical protein
MQTKEIFFPTGSTGLTGLFPAIRAMAEKSPRGTGWQRGVLPPRYVRATMERAAGAGFFSLPVRGKLKTKIL